MLRLFNDLLGSVLPSPKRLEAVVQELESEIAAQAQTQHGAKEDRTQAEEALRQAEEKYRSIFENAAEGIFQTTLDGRFLSANPALVRMYGYDSQADLIADLNDVEQQLYVDPHRRAEFIRILERQTSVSNFEVQVYRKDGRIIWISENARAVRDAQGNLLYFEGSVQDITERKQAEVGLRHSETGFALAADGASDGIWDWDIQTGYAYLSPRWKQFLGYEDDEIPNRVESWEQSLHPDDAKRVKETLKAYLARAIPTYEVEFRALHKDGSYRWISARGAALWDQTGKPYRMAGSHTDITERKHREEALKLIVEGMTSKIGDEFFRSCVYHLAEVLQVRYVVVSEFANETKTRVRALAFWNGEEWLEGVEYDTAFTPCGEVLKGKMHYVPKNVQTLFPGSNLIAELGAESFWGIPLFSSTKEVIGHLAALDVKPMPQGPDEEQILKIFAARTAAELERKQADIKLQQAKEAAEIANRAKSIFLANMSHELRTPLNAILGFTQVMSLDSRLSPEHQENLGIINRSGEHLLALINDVLEMAKIEAGQVSLNNRPFDLHRLLKSLQEMLQIRAAAKGLQLIFEHSPTIPQYVNTDEGKLRQVLINLLENAIKFTQAGSVRLRLRVGRMGEQREQGEQSEMGETGEMGEMGEMRKMGEKIQNPKFKIQNSKFPSLLHFEIEDTGPGIETDEVKALFQAFVQTEAGRQSQQGTGLGLAISHQFVKLMGGDISVNSVLGQGTTFQFDIQVEFVQKTAEVGVTPTSRKVIGLAPNQPHYRILVVEDNRVNRLALVRLLQSLGFEVQEASNGEEAIAQWRRWRPDLIWMDIRMPVMDGCEATRRIKAEGLGTELDEESDKIQNPKSKIQNRTSPIIIALTASAFEEDRAAILAAGCDDIVNKPFRQAIIFDKMAHYLGVRYLYHA